MSRRLRVTSSPPTTGPWAGWAQETTDAINGLPAFSLSSTTNGPNASIVSGDSGTILLDVGSSATTFWGKRSGSTTTGWAAFVFSPIGYGDLPTGSGTWAPGSAATVTLNASLWVNSKLSVGGLTGPLRADAGLVSVDATLSSGTYLPTRSLEVNLDSNVSVSVAQYARVGDVVGVSGLFAADPTLTATATSFELSLPVASNFGGVYDLAGTAFCGAIAGQGAQVVSSITSNTAAITWVSGDITAQIWSYHYTYRVI